MAQMAFAGSEAGSVIARHAMRGPRPADESTAESTSDSPDMNDSRNDGPNADANDRGGNPRGLRHRLISVLRMPLTYVMLAAIALRIGFARWIGVWFWGGMHWDDTLLFRYSLGSHFADPTDEELFKVAGYSWFLAAVRKLHWDYPTCVALLWVAAALVVFALVFAVCRRRWVAFAAFVYVLFYPSAFEADIGTRMYRNSVLIPLYVVVIGLAVLVVWKVAFDRFSVPGLLVLSVVLGVGFSYTYYVKEDGAWLAASLAAAFAVGLGVYAVVGVGRWRSRKRGSVSGGSVSVRGAGASYTLRRFVSAVLAAVVPFACLAGVTAAYKAVNKKYFGIAQTQTRVSGQLFGFVERVYAIDSPNRSMSVWAPADAIDAAFAASPTLAKETYLHDMVVHSQWIGGDPTNFANGRTMYEAPFPGDMFTWGMHTALLYAGLWQSQQQVDDMFRQVNAELDRAFANGTLKKSTRFQLVPSAGGFTRDEMGQCFVAMLKGYNGVLRLVNYAPGSKAGDYRDMNRLDEYPYVGVQAAQAFNLPYLADYSLREGRFGPANRVVSAVFAVYRVVNALMAVLLAVVLVGGVVRLCRRRRIAAPLTGRMVLFWLTDLALVLLSAVYTYAMSWFDVNVTGMENYNYSWANYYNLGTVSLLVLAFSLALAIAANAWTAHRQAQEFRREAQAA